MLLLLLLVLFILLLLLLLLLFIFLFLIEQLEQEASDFNGEIAGGEKTGDEYYQLAEHYKDHDNYLIAAELYWNAVVLSTVKKQKYYTTDQAYQKFGQLYKSRGLEDEAYIFIAKQYLSRGDMKTGRDFLNNALKVNKNNVEVYQLLAKSLPVGQTEAIEKIKYLKKAIKIDPNNAHTYYEMGVT